MKKVIKILGERINYRSIQFTISASFTLIMVICMCFLGVVLYSKFFSKTEETMVKSAERLLNQTNINLETYLRNMMRISDSFYYTVIKDMDIFEESMDYEMNLLYEANKDDLVSIACFQENGTLVGAAPVNTRKNEVDITDQEWFQIANQRMENLHFSVPHVQNIFDDTSYRYYWVISLSRMVELTSRGNNIRGVLLVDMNFSGIEKLFKKSNYNNEEVGYIYLMDSDGKIIYHPKQRLINSGVVMENNVVASQYEDGSHNENFQGENRVIAIKTVGYTGWKIVYVISKSYFNMSLNQIRYFAILIISITLLILVFVNQFVSWRIAEPIMRLDQSVKGLENGNLDIVVYDGGGSAEIEHLGKSLNSVVAQLRKLMDEIVVEQEEKRRAELDALQSQINPHFLYNTLDSIVWMIEGERYWEAVCMVTDLASLFRISLSRGKNVISIKDEISHAKNYMNIQKIRYKDKFEIFYEIDSNILKYSTIKLVIQPLLENAIYYGVDAMFEEAEIWVKGYKKQDAIFIEVIDNGLGMTKEMVDSLLTDNSRKRTKGSGVGLINVHKRIQLRYGKMYGLEIESQPDEGTLMRIYLPAIPFEERIEKAGENNES